MGVFDIDPAAMRTATKKQTRKQTTQKPQNVGTLKKLNVQSTMPRVTPKPKSKAEVISDKTGIGKAWRKPSSPIAKHKKDLEEALKWTE